MESRQNLRISESWWTSLHVITVSMICFTVVGVSGSLRLREICRSIRSLFVDVVVKKANLTLPGTAPWVFTPHVFTGSIQLFCRSQWPRGLRRRSAVARLLGFGFESHRKHGNLSVVSVVCVVRKRSLRRTDHSSREVLPIVARRCLWSRNLKNEEAMARVGPQRHRKIKAVMCQTCGNYDAVLWYPALPNYPYNKTDTYKGADKSLARPGGNKRMFLSEFPSAPCLAGKETWWQLASPCCLKSRASLTCFRDCFLPGRVKDLSAPR